MPNNWQVAHRISRLLVYLTEYSAERLEKDYGGEIESDSAVMEMPASVNCSVWAVPLSFTLAGFLRLHSGFFR